MATETTTRTMIGSATMETTTCVKPLSTTGSSQPTSSSNSIHDHKIRAIKTLDEWYELVEHSSSTNNKLVVVKFTADWASPCIKMMPHYYDLFRQHTSATAASPEENSGSRIRTKPHHIIAEDELIEASSNDEENDDIEFVIVDVEIADEEIEQSYNANVVALPTFQCYRNGIKIDELIGAVHVSKLHNFITKNRGNNRRSGSREGSNNNVSTGFVQQ